MVRTTCSGSSQDSQGTTTPYSTADGGPGNKNNNS